MSLQVLLLAAHSGWRYVVIFVVLAVLAKFLIGWIGRAQWSEWDQRLGAAAPIVFDVQVLLGLVLWIVSSGWQFAPRQAWEHPLTMLAALAIMHGTWLAVKRTAAADRKFRLGFLGYLAGAVVMGIGIWRITSG